MNNCIIFFDLETTGVSVSNDKIIQLSAIKTDLELNILEKKNILINPGTPIPKEASDVHKITDEMVKDKPFFISYAKAIIDYFNNSILAGYNIKNFDIPFLYEELFRCGYELNIKNIIDCYKIFSSKEKRNLEAALKFYSGEDGIEGGAHDAENDNIATIKVFKGQLFMYDISIEESFKFSYDNSVDLSGKIILNENGIAVYSFGKDKGKSVKQFPGFGTWMLRNDFTLNTKNVIRSLIS